MEFGGYVISNSNPGKKYFVWYDGTKWNCDCMSGEMGHECLHKRKMAIEIVKTHEEKECFYCGKTFWIQGLDQHHVYRRSTHPELKDDPKNIMWLCRQHHDKATLEKEFEENLQKLWKIRHER